MECHLKHYLNNIRYVVVEFEMKIKGQNDPHPYKKITFEIDDDKYNANEIFEEFN